MPAFRRLVNFIGEAVENVPPSSGITAPDDEPIDVEIGDPDPDADDEAEAMIEVNGSAASPDTLGAGVAEGFFQIRHLGRIQIIFVDVWSVPTSLLPQLWLVRAHRAPFAHVTEIGFASETTLSRAGDGSLLATPVSRAYDFAFTRGNVRLPRNATFVYWKTDATASIAGKISGISSISDRNWGVPNWRRFHPQPPMPNGTAAPATWGPPADDITVDNSAGVFGTTETMNILQPDKHVMDWGVPGPFFIRVDGYMVPGASGIHFHNPYQRRLVPAGSRVMFSQGVSDPRTARLGQGPTIVETNTYVWGERVSEEITENIVQLPQSTAVDVQQVAVAQWVVARPFDQIQPALPFADDTGTRWDITGVTRVDDRISRVDVTRNIGEDE